MNIYLGHLSNFIQKSKPSTFLRSILEDARMAGKQVPSFSPDRTLAVRLPEETVEWLRQQAEAKDCAMAEVARAYIADQIVSELTDLYQHNNISTAEFSAALWSALGYEPTLPGGEAHKNT
jgi:hypothetical protein